MADLKASLELSTIGASRAVRFANRFNRAQRQAQDEIQVGINRAGHAGVAVLKRHAPVGRVSHEKFHKTGTLRDAIGILSGPRSGRSASRPSIIIGIDEEKASSPRLFPYSEVTRRGRRAFSVKVARRSTSHERPTARVLTENGRPTARRLGRAAALAFPDKHGRLIYRRSVGRYQPGSDWVVDSEPEVRAAAQKEMDATAQHIATFLRSGFARAVRTRRV